ncbi:MAG TPA: peptidoglycan editing factor PgeF [Candidatus Polarisedimenticolia bacterium]|nr:peptidoglycan editing factor PgeF [Candidatus Polarisedimenticolia bacterium]
MRRTGVGRSSRLTLVTLDSVPGLAHAFSLRNSTTEAIVQAAMSAATPLRLLRQVHGAAVRVIGGDETTKAANGATPEGDALVTDRTGVAIGVRVADCVPILVCDPVRRGIAAVHAGWRGTVAGVLTATLETLTRRFGASAADMRLAIGPAIGPCCFEVGDEVIDSLLHHDPGAATCVRLEGRRRLVDLTEANRRQALAAGVPSAQIRSANLCTVCHPELFLSYRREPARAGRMLAFIGWSN